MNEVETRAEHIDPALKAASSSQVSKNTSTKTSRNSGGTTHLNDS